MDASTQNPPFKFDIEQQVKSLFERGIIVGRMNTFTTQDNKQLPAENIYAVWGEEMKYPLPFFESELKLDNGEAKDEVVAQVPTEERANNRRRNYNKRITASTFGKLGVKTHSRS